MAIQDIIFTPDQLAEQHVRYGRKLINEPGIRWGFQEIDRVIRPMIGGDVGVILGRPGDGKTTTLLAHFLEQCRNIERDGLQKQEANVFISWEETVDQLYASAMAARSVVTDWMYSITDFYRAEVPIEDITRVAQGVGIIPAYFIGFSSFRKAPYKKITLDMVLEAIDCIGSGAGVPKRKIRMGYADYLQIISFNRFMSRTDSTTEAIIELSNIGKRLDMPWLTGAQSGRQVDTYNIKLALPSDAQHASIIEQHTDFGYSIWRPIRTEPYDPRQNQVMDIWGRQIPLFPELFIIKNWKQRRGPSGHWWAMRMVPELAELSELELDVEDLGFVYDGDE